MILMYHNFGPEPGFNTVSTDQLQAQFRHLAGNYNVIGFPDYVEKVLSGDLGRDDVALTVDDAYVGFRDHCLPLLERFSFSAALFVPVGHVGSYNAWDKGQTRLEIMDWDALRKLHNEAPVTLGAHGWTHVSLGKRGKANLLREIDAPKKRMEQAFETEIRYFAFPYGQPWDMQPAAFAQLEASGYRAACSTIWNRRNIPRMQYHLRRMEVRPEDDIRDFAAMLRRQYHPRFLKDQAKRYLHKLGLRT